MKRAWLNYLHLSAIVILEYRQWLGLLVTLTVFLNLGMMFSFSFIAGSRDPELGSYVVPGAAILALVTLGISTVANDMAQQRRTGTIQYYAALPISKTAYILAMVTANGAAALPGMLVTVLVGGWLFNLSFVFNPLIFVIIPLSAVSLASLGAAIGLGIKNWRLAGLVAQAVMFFIIFFAPVMIPLQRLPGLLQATGALLPPTYAARAFRAALMGIGTPADILLDIGILAAFAAGSIVLVSRTLEWRLE